MAIVSSFTLAVKDLRHVLLASVERTGDPSVSGAPGLDAVAMRLLHVGVLDGFHSRRASA